MVSDGGCEVDRFDPDGRTLLHIVARHRMNRRGPAGAAMLVDNGVDLRAKDPNNRSALDVASASGNMTMVDVLV